MKAYDINMYAGKRANRRSQKVIVTGFNSLNSIALRPWTYFDVELLETEEEKFASLLRTYCGVYRGV